MEFNLNQDGFVMNYLFSGKKETQIYDDTRDTNQLRYEKYLRNKIADKEAKPEKDIKIGELSSLGMPWRYYYSYNNIFLDQSTFYTDLKKVELYGATHLIAEEDMEVQAWLFSYASITIWVNEEYAGAIDTPVYKPIQRQEIKLKLNKGVNRIFISLATLGVRDTRVSFALQIKEGQEKIRVSLPDIKGTLPYIEGEQIINSAILKDKEITFSNPLPTSSFIRYNLENPDFRAKMDDKYKVEDVSGSKNILLKEYPSFSISVKVGEYTLSRAFERISLRRSKYLNPTECLKATMDNHRRNIYEEISKITSLTRSGTDGFALYPMLARYYLGKNTKSDDKELKITLQQIDRRMDCADFMTCALIRLMKLYELSEDMKGEIKQVMLNFRYWMDEEGQDGMCFWSENHALMFYQTGYFFGMEYEEEVFTRSKKTGRLLYETSKERIKEWLSDIILTGFDEFNSGVYGPITFAAILNLVDFGEEEIAEEAKKAADLLLRRIAIHCFREVVISPGGRIYRNALYPHLQPIQSIVHYICDRAPYVYSEWLIALANSKYEIPEDFIPLMEAYGEFTYSTSNGVIDLYKTKDYMLTSVQSPRRYGAERTWQWELKEEERHKYSYTKSLNECFHGTMDFRPGVLGYQQHLWSAALDRELTVFVTHPGESCEAASEGRPGYWHGNGIMPALYQNKNVLGMIYVIPETHPIGFTHLFWNSKGFDETSTKGGWLFGKKGTGYIGIWCSTGLVDHNDRLFQCEKRAYGRNTAYLCVCKSEEEIGSYDEFIKSCIGKSVIYDEKNQILSFEELKLTYKAYRNESQYVG